MTNIQEVLDIVEKAKAAFASQLQELTNRGGLSKEMYVRYLTFQFHLTKGVQRHFLKVAGHPRRSWKAGLRNFLFKFALEEEAHQQSHSSSGSARRGNHPARLTRNARQRPALSRPGATHAEVFAGI